MWPMETVFGRDPGSRNFQFDNIWQKLKKLVSYLPLNLWVENGKNKKIVQNNN